METYTPTPPIPANTPEQSDVLLEWSAPSHQHHTRGWKWYAVTGLVLIACLLFGIFTSAWSFLLVLVMCVALYAYVHRIAPQQHTIRIRKKDFLFDGRQTAWEECEGFWMLRSKEYMELHIERTQGLTRHVMIQTGTVDPYQIYELLSTVTTHLADRRESKLDAFIRICKL